MDVAGTMGIAVGGTALVVAIAAIVIIKTSGETGGSVFEGLLRRDEAVGQGV